VTTKDNGTLRTFASGATRDTASGKLDPEGFLDPLVVVAFAEYMDRHRIQSDGSLRASDNWQAGFPRSQTMKSLWRHFLDLWLLHRGHPPVSKDHRAFYEKDRTARFSLGFLLPLADAYALESTKREVLCALYFNVSAYLREVILGRSISEVAEAPAHPEPAPHYSDPADIGG
jgi:hypothetical protein